MTDDRRLLRGGPAVERRMLSRPSGSRQTSRVAAGMPHRRRRHGPNNPSSRRPAPSVAVAKDHQRSDNVAVLAPQVKGDAGSHEQHS